MGVNSCRSGGLIPITKSRVTAKPLPRVSVRLKTVRLILNHV
jgi:hypothetical protein